jgi:hypothetical protein
MITLKGTFLSGVYGAVDIMTKYLDEQQGLKAKPLNWTNGQRFAVSTISLLLNIAGYFDEETTILFYASLPKLEETIAKVAGATFAKSGIPIGFTQELTPEAKKVKQAGGTPGPVY